jgi:proton translocating ATP synthase F1 alpha subunit
LSAFSACAVGEVIGTFSSDAVVAYDDLTKQSVCYRQVSLLLRRPPGREAFPGDVFYLHSRLLERAAKYHALYGAGSSTALPVIETQLGDVSAYIPTNVISITDGQMFFDNESFKKGIRPALDVNLSVSRVGSICQWPIMRKLSAELKISLALFKEVEIYATFASDLDAATRYTLNRGARLIELLKQAKHQPLSRDQEVLLLFAGVKGYLDEISKEKITYFKKFLLEFASQTNIFFEIDPYKPIVDHPFEILMSESLRR